MRKPLSDTELKSVINANQIMMSEWLIECKADGYCGMFMVCMDMKETELMKGLRLFHSEGMPMPAVIRNLKHITAMLEQNNFKRAEGDIEL